MQKLLTKELQKKLPPLYSQDGKKAETVVYGHWFSCLNGWDFYATEYDEETGDMFGFVFGAVPEMGYFNLAELEEINRKYGMNFFERETYFTPKRAIEIPRIAEAFGYPWEK